MLQWSSIHFTFSCHPSLNICKPRQMLITPLYSSIKNSPVFPLDHSLQNRLHPPVICRSRSRRLPYSRNWHHGNPQRPSPCGQRQWRPRLTDMVMQTHNSGTQTALQPDSHISQRDPFSSQSRGREKERLSRGKKQAVIHQNLFNTSCTALLPAYKHLSLHKCFEIIFFNEFFFLCYSSCSFQWYREAEKTFV